MNTFDIDAYSPAQMAVRVEKAGITKGNLDGWSTLVLAMLAGAFIAFGAVFYTFVIHDATMSIGVTRLLGGLVFCLGLVLVIVAGAELFTGNNLCRSCKDNAAAKFEFGVGRFAGSCAGNRDRGGYHQQGCCTASGYIGRQGL
jgi:hypothetical protein